jgi:hypothetical protein
MRVNSNRCAAHAEQTANATKAIRAALRTTDRNILGEERDREFMRHKLGRQEFSGNQKGGPTSEE